MTETKRRKREGKMYKKEEKNIRSRIKDMNRNSKEGEEKEIRNIEEVKF
jgi:hypothetical protein